MSMIPNIEDIYNGNSKSLYFTSLRIIGNSFDAEDIMQETIIDYYKISHKQEIKNIGGWLRSVCIRKSIDMLRQREKDNKYRDSIGDDLKNQERTQENENEGEAARLIDKIKRIILSLPGRSRMIVSLHLFEGYDDEEIAQITGISQSGIRSQFMRGRNKIAEELNKTEEIKSKRQIKQ